MLGRRIATASGRDNEGIRQRRESARETKSKNVNSSVDVMRYDEIMLTLKEDVDDVCRDMTRWQCSIPSGKPAAALVGGILDVYLPLAQMQPTFNW